MDAPADQGMPGRFLFVSIDLIKHKTVDVNANPYSNPEINLFLLLDSYLVKYCTVPSIASGNIKIKMLRWKVWNGAAIKAIKWPMVIPVHLAHKGNWYPLKKKLRSGILEAEMARSKITQAKLAKILGITPSNDAVCAIRWLSPSEDEIKACTQVVAKRYLKFQSSPN